MPTVLAVDPGREKCGVAVVNSQAVLLRAIVPTVEIGLTCLHLLARHPGAQVIVGDATGSAEVSSAIRQANPAAAITVVPESFSTLAARKLYEQDNPPSGLRRLVPAGMRVPPRPVDDYAALALARAYLAAHE
jgi:hypothetical protein